MTIDHLCVSAWLRAEAKSYTDPRNVAWNNEAADTIDAMAKAKTALTGHLVNAAIVLESGGTKKEAIRILDAGIAIGKEMGEA